MGMCYHLLDDMSLINQSEVSIDSIDQSKASIHTDLTNEQLTLTAAGDFSAGHHCVLY